MEVYRYGVDVGRLEPVVNAILKSAEEEKVTVRELKLCLQIVEEIVVNASFPSKLVAELDYGVEKGTIAWRLQDHPVDRYVYHAYK